MVATAHLKKLSKQAASILNSISSNTLRPSQLSDEKTRMIDLIEHSSVSEGIHLLVDQHNASLKRQFCLAQRVIQDIHIKEQSLNPGMAIQHLSQDSLKDAPFYPTHDINMTVYIYAYSAAGRIAMYRQATLSRGPLGGSFAMLVLHDLERIAMDELLKIPSFALWENERKDYGHRLAVLDATERLKIDLHSSPHHEMDDGAINDALTVIRAIEEMASTALSMSTCKIQQITYKFYLPPGALKDVLKMYIHESVNTFKKQKAAEFSGKIAKAINFILNNRSQEEIEIKDLPGETQESMTDRKKYDQYYRMFQAANNYIAKTFPQFGIGDFFVFSTYTVKINEAYVDYIK